MQKAPIASVSTGPVSPTVMGPEKEMKDVYIMSGLVFFLAVVVSAFWYYSQADEAAHSNPSTEALNSTQVSQVLKHSTDHAPVAASIQRRMWTEPRWQPAVPTSCTTIFTLKSAARD